MKQFNTLFGTIAGTALALACIESYAGTTASAPNHQAVEGAAIIMLADNSSKPAMGGEGDGVPGGNAPNPDPDRATSTVVDDATITAEVNTKLLGDTTVSGLKIDVDTRSGVVYLTGDNMKSQATIDHAIKLAKETDGVKNVVSKLAVGDIKN